MMPGANSTTVVRDKCHAIGKLPLADQLYLT